jgi:hypothetical protein
MLKTDLFNSIEKHIDSLLTTISTKYNIDKNELKNLWCNLDESTNVEVGSQRTEEVTQSVPVTETTTTTTTEKAYDITKIHEYDVKTLKGILKSLGLKVSGKKADLLSRIMNSDKEPKKSPSRKSPAKTSSSKKKKQTRLLPVNGKVELQKRQIHFKKIDDFHVHEDSNLIIDSETKMIIGKYDIDTKSMVNLTESDIETCKQYKFRYNVPDNLSSTNSKKEDSNKLKDKLSDILKEESQESITEDVKETEDIEETPNEEVKVEDTEEVKVEVEETEEVEVEASEEEVEVEVEETEEVEVEVSEEEVEETEEVEVEESEEEVEVEVEETEEVDVEESKEEVEVEVEETEEVEVEESEEEVEVEVEETEEVEVEVEQLVDEIEEETEEQLKQKEFEDELDDLLDSDSDIEYEEVVVYE